jgi:serine protease Do
VFKKLFNIKQMNEPGFSRGIAIGLAMTLLILGGALGFRKTAAERQVAAEKQSPAVTASAGTAGMGLPTQLSRDFETVSQQVKGAVVNINTEQIIHNTAAPMQDPFQQFFGGQSPFEYFYRQMPHDLKQKSLGSGFLVDPNGYILTNNHVVDNATKIQVKLEDGRTLDAKVVGTDPQTDLAVLKINGSSFPTLHLGNSDQINVGDWVLAFGSPFGLQNTMTAGIISAKGRVIGAGPYDNFLQTDAAINPGNSGGPLVNLKGEVVGINTMIASENGGFQGIGFAIPASMAGRIYDQLVKNGKVTRGWLGVTIQNMTPELAKSFHVGPDTGVLVADVEAGSPASRGGVQSGDVILEYDGKALHSPNDLSIAVAQTKAGDAANMKILRDGKDISLVVHVGERPDDISQNFPSSGAQEHGKLGVTVENITPQTARQLNLSSNVGALVTEVQPGSPADEGGLLPGDVIRQIDQVPVHNAAELVATASKLKAGDTVMLRVERQGKNLFLAFDLS